MRSVCQAADCQETDRVKGDINATLSKYFFFSFFCILPDHHLTSSAVNAEYAWVDLTS